MALESTTAAGGKSEWIFSAEEAERFAARIRPSWELDGDLAADAAEGAEPEVDLGEREPAAAASARAEAPPMEAPDTVIQGVPTIAIGGDEAATAPAATAPAARGEAAEDAERKGSGSQRSTANGANAAAAIAPAGKTKVGLGDDEAAARAASPPRSARDTGGRDQAVRPTDDAIEIPVSGGGKSALLKIAIAVVGLGMVFFAGRALIGSDGKGADVAPEPPAKPAATAPAPTQAAAPTATPTAEAAPAPTATATAAPTATATATAAPIARVATAAPTISPAAATPAQPSATARPATTATVAAGDKPAPATTKPAGSPPSGGKKGGGIIRDAPF
jgi:hypothetical protein